MQDTKVHRVADVNNDHYLVIVKIRLRLQASHITNREESL